jgi:hypothetical protein
VTNVVSVSREITFVEGKFVPLAWHALAPSSCSAAYSVADDGVANLLPKLSTDCHLPSKLPPTERLL